MPSIVCLFLHRYRWGQQVRGDERGFLEKAAQYKTRGVRLLTVERAPSLQTHFGGDLYTSFETGEFRLPIRDVVDLAVALVKSVRTIGSLRKAKPIAVYAYNQDPENVVTGLAFKLLLGRRLVVVYHHISKLSFSPIGVGIAARRTKGYGILSSVWLSLVPAINRKCAQLADVHLALSVSTRKEVNEWLGVEDCVVVGNGIDTDKFRRVEAEMEYDAAFLGRIVPQKGIDTLLRAWSLVIKQRPNSKLVLIGGADPDQMRRFRGFAAEEGVTNSVDFKGFLSDSDVVRTLSSSKIFVFPSLAEGFAQAVSQAMACELCCVISDIPSLRETYGSVAFLVPPGDPRALADQVISVLSREAELITRGDRSRQFVKKFDWGEVVDKELGALRRSMN